MAARSLVGALLVASGPVPEAQRVGRIVEVEAYVGEEDAASHARFGRTARNGIMYGLPGAAYVYRVYGMYSCLNVVTEPEGMPAAVLVRAVEPVAGASLMRRAREERARTRGRSVPVVADVRLASGPGLVGDAFDLSVTDTGLDLCDPASRIHLELPDPVAPPPRVVATPRIGIGYAAEPWRSMPWRFLDAESPSISRRAR